MILRRSAWLGAVPAILVACSDPQSPSQAPSSDAAEDGSTDGVAPEAAGDAGTADVDAAQDGAQDAGMDAPGDGPLDAVSEPAQDGAADTGADVDVDAGPTWALLGPGVWVSPARPAPGEVLQIRYEGTLVGASSVAVHFGFNGWNDLSGTGASAQDDGTSNLDYFLEQPLSHDGSGYAGHRR